MTNDKDEIKLVPFNFDKDKPIPNLTIIVLYDEKGESYEVVVHTSN